MARWPLLGCLLLIASLLGGCSGPGSTGGLDIRAIDIAAPEVGAGHVLIALNVTFKDVSKATDKDVVQVKTYDQSMGFLVHTDETPLRKGLPAGKPVEVDVELPREGSYSMDIIVLHDGKPGATGHVDLRDLSRLQPTLHDTGLRIDLDFQLLGAADNRTDLQVSAYMTNEGRATSKPLVLQLKARDVRTSLIAGQVWVQVGSIGPDETKPANGTMDVALGHDYDVEAVLWDGNVIVERGVGRVGLASLSTAPSGGTGIQGLRSADAADFVFGEPSFDSGGSSKENTPGLGIVAVAAVLGAAAFLLRRRAA